MLTACDAVLFASWVFYGMTCDEHVNGVMKQAYYEFDECAKDLAFFRFTSVGGNGSIQKQIDFDLISSTCYNLAFGDIIHNNEMDDYAVSNNNDTNKILVTVAKAVEKYLTRYPNRVIRFEGNTPGRNRLYKMAISRHLEEISTKYNLFLEYEGIAIPFVKNIDTKKFWVKNKH